MPKVTYVPQEGDPSTVTWNGHKFTANVPREVSNAEMLKLAATNPWFDVEGSPAPTAIDEAKRRGRPPKPKTAEEYRAWAVSWIGKSETSADLQSRWDGEADLRTACGVGGDDLDYIATIMQPRLAELQKSGL